MQSKGINTRLSHNILYPLHSSVIYGYKIESACDFSFIIPGILYKEMPCHSPQCLLFSGRYRVFSATIGIPVSGLYFHEYYQQIPYCNNVKLTIPAIPEIPGNNCKSLLNQEMACGFFTRIPMNYIRQVGFRGHCLQHIKQVNTHF